MDQASSPLAESAQRVPPEIAETPSRAALNSDGAPHREEPLPGESAAHPMDITYDKDTPLPSIEEDDPLALKHVWHGISRPEGFEPAQNLSSFHIEVHLRLSEQLLVQWPDHSFLICIDVLCFSKYSNLMLAAIRGRHLDFDRFLQVVASRMRELVDLDFTFNPAQHEIGYSCMPQLDRLLYDYDTVTDQDTFVNAIHKLHNEATRVADPEQSSLILHFWVPKPEQSFWHREVGIDPPSQPDAPETPSGEKGTDAGVEVVGSDAALIDTGVHIDSVSNSGSGSGFGPDPDPDSSSDAEFVLGNLDDQGSDSSSPSKTSDRVGDLADAFSQAKIDQILEGAHDIDIQKINKAAADASGELPAPVRSEGMSRADFDELMRDYVERLKEREGQLVGDAFDTEVVARMSADTWVKVCDMFHHDPNYLEPQYVVAIKGFARKLLPCQSYCVYEALLQIHSDVGAIILGHAMGAGKTTIAISIMHVQHVFNLMWHEIKQDPANHCTRNQRDATTCLYDADMRARFGFNCPCAPGRPIYAIKMRLGVAVVLIPRILFPVWQKDFANCYRGVSDDDSFGITMLRAHDKWNLPLSGEQYDEFSATVYPPENNGFDAKTQTWVARPTCRPRLTNSKYIFLTTSDSYPSRVEERMQKKFTVWAVPLRLTKQQKAFHSPAYTPLCIGQIYRDEFHIERNQSSKTITAVAKIKTFLQLEGFKIPLMLWMSGTPLTGGPIDVAAPIQVSERPSWRNIPGLKHAMNGEATKMGRDWNATFNGKNVQAGASRGFIQKLRPIIEVLMHRITGDTNFLGSGPCWRTPTNVLKNQECPVPKEWQIRVLANQAKEKERIHNENEARRRQWIELHGNDKDFKSVRSVYYQSRLWASFPFLQELRNAEGVALKLTKEEWATNTTGEEAVWTQDTETDPYYHNMEEIFSSSGKLVEMAKILEAFRDRKDCKDLPQRWILASAFWLGARLIYLYLRHVLNVPDNQIVFVTQLQTPTAQERKLKHFMREPLVVKGKEQVLNEPAPQFLVCNSSCITVGITFKDVCHILLFEPDIKVSTIYQMFCRHCRQGNCNEHTWSWMLVAEGNPVENLIMERNKFRQRISQVYRTNKDVEYIDSSDSDNNLDSDAD